ncbi:MAG: hypothetical protein KAT83_01275, partial [Candidatus Aenigmarchaeota archaeon]|nr:hypothetical protein [Candidatus Aenigmarchaeota archaeon]
IEKDAVTDEIKIKSGLTYPTGSGAALTNLPLQFSKVGEISGVLAQHDAQIISAVTTYTLRKTITLNKLNAGTTLSFQWKQAAAGGNTSYAKIYKNGVAVGTEKASASGFPAFSTETDTPATTFDAGDTAELWLKSPSATNGFIKDFRILGSPYLDTSNS